MGDLTPDERVRVSHAVARRLRELAAREGWSAEDVSDLVDRALRDYIRQREGDPLHGGVVRSEEMRMQALPDLGRGGFAALEAEPPPFDRDDRWADEASRAREKAYARAGARVFGNVVDLHEAMEILAPPEHVVRRPEAVAPWAVRLGLRPDDEPSLDWRTEALAFAPPDDPTPLSGLTNRIAPTLWSSSELVRLVSRRGQAVTAVEFLREVMPGAWTFGAGLKEWEDDQRAQLRARPGMSRAGLPFHAAARWPSLSGRMLREASSATSFVSFSLGTWASRTSQFDGPLASLGLVEVAPGPDGWWRLRPSERGVDLARDLAGTSASCEYPHEEDAWRVLEPMLTTSPTRELERMALALAAFVRARNTEEFEQQVVERVPSPTGKPLGARALATEAGGHLARLREMGLVQIGSRRFGEQSITERGYRLLDRA